MAFTGHEPGPGDFPHLWRGLQQVGLNSYEARTYLVLLGHPRFRALELAVEHQCRSVALPALSTGAYGYPMDEASRVALRTAISFVRECGEPELVRFVLFDRAAMDAFARSLQAELPDDVPG